jgi:acetyl-CoA carboxylase carboxyltransferase component
MDPRRIEELHQVKASQLDAARPEAVEWVHRAGRLTARERIAALLDPGSEVPYGAIAARTAEGTWVAEAGGVDVVGTVGGQTVVASSTDFTDKGGGYGAGRLERLFALAHEHRWPVVLFVDGGGSRARHPRVDLGHRELNGPFGRFQLFDGIAELSGWVPTVAIVSGPSFAGHASLAGFSDLVIAIGGSSIGMGGPPMVEAALGTTLSAHELAGVEMHERTGGIDLLVGDEPEAIAAAKRYLAYQVDEASGPAPTGPDGSPGEPADPAPLVPAEGPYDMVPVVEAIVDQGSLFPLRPRFAPSVITALARLDGRSVGIIASQPAVDGGAIDESGATKVNRMVELCDSYELPILSLIDTPGCVTRRGATTGSEPGVAPGGVNRWHARPIMAHHHRTVPLFAVQVRRGGGLGPAVLGGLASGRSVPVAWLAWPTTETGRADGFSAVRNQDAYDDVVAPVETRQRVVRLLEHLPRPPGRTTKKHPVDTW